MLKQTINKYNKNYDRGTESSYLEYLDANNLFGWTMSQKLLVDGFKQLENGFRKSVLYVVHIRALKQALNHRLILKKIYRVIQFNQEAWLKPYIDINTKLRKKAKNDSFKFLSKKRFL